MLLHVLKHTTVKHSPHNETNCPSWQGYKLFRSEHLCYPLPPLPPDSGKVDRLQDVLLRTNLQKARIIARDHNGVKKLAAIAIASNGYQLVFSQGETFDFSAAEGMLVDVEKIRQPLADDKGRIALIPARNLRSGQRYVTWSQQSKLRTRGE